MKVVCFYENEMVILCNLIFRQHLASIFEREQNWRQAAQVLVNSHSTKKPELFFVFYNFLSFFLCFLTVPYILLCTVGGYSSGDGTEAVQCGLQARNLSENLKVR